MNNHWIDLDLEPMPRNRLKPSTNLMAEDILQEIKSIRPLRLFINKQKKKGNGDNPFSLRAKFCKLPQEKQVRFLQKSVDKYIELLDEKDVDENLQIECKLFNHLLMKTEQKKYFQSINAPTKPPGSAVPYFTQFVKQETDDDIEWSSLSVTEQQNYKKMRREAKFEYSAQVRNFANDLPERLRTDYLLFTQQSTDKHQINGNNSFTNEHSQLTTTAKPIRQRRKSLTALPDSLQTNSTTSIDDVQTKLTKCQLRELHQCMPFILYYENDVPDRKKPQFTRVRKRNAHIRSLYNELNEDERLEYISQSVVKWKEFLQFNPQIVDHQIPTLHLLLPRNDDIALYFSSIGLPRRPPINSYLLYNLEKDDDDSSQAWTKLSQTERFEYSQQLAELKEEYYQQLVRFIDKHLPTDYLKYEFFRNVKYAIKDYESATKSEIVDKTSGQWKFVEAYKKRTEMNYALNQCHEIKQKLFSTNLNDEQRNLVEELTQLLYKYVE